MPIRPRFSSSHILLHISSNSSLITVEIVVTLRIPWKPWVSLSCFYRSSLSGLRRLSVSSQFLTTFSFTFLNKQLEVFSKFFWEPCFLPLIGPIYSPISRLSGSKQDNWMFADHYSIDGWESYWGMCILLGASSVLSMEVFVLLNWSSQTFIKVYSSITFSNQPDVPIGFIIVEK